MVTTTRRFRGFTLIEVIVSCGILGVLVALLLPVVLSSRAAARRTTCSHHLRELALGLCAFDTAFGELPGFSNAITRPPTKWRVVGRQRAYDIADPKMASWCVMLFPYIGEEPLWSEWNAPETTPNRTSGRVDLLVCPSDSHISWKGMSPLSYSVNGGRSDQESKVYLEETQGPDAFRFPAAHSQQLDNKANGLFFDKYYHYYWVQRGAHHIAPPHALGLNDRDIADGTSKTLLVSENLQAVSYDSQRYTAEQYTAFVWHDMARMPADFFHQFDINDPRPINGDRRGKYLRWAEGKNAAYWPEWAPSSPDMEPIPLWWSRPSSEHGGGVNAVFADSHIEFLSETMAYSLLQRRMTSSDEACDLP